MRNADFNQASRGSLLEAVAFELQSKCVRDIDEAVGQLIGDRCEGHLSAWNVLSREIS